MDAQVNLLRPVAGGYVHLAYNVGDVRDHRLEERFNALEIGDPASVPQLEETLRMEFTWKGYDQVHLRYIRAQKEAS